MKSAEKSAGGVAKLADAPDVSGGRGDESPDAKSLIRPCGFKSRRRHCYFTMFKLSPQPCVSTATDKGKKINTGITDLPVRSAKIARHKAPETATETPRGYNFGHGCKVELAGATMNKRELCIEEALTDCDELIIENLRMLRAIEARIAKGAGPVSLKESVEHVRNKTDLLRNVCYYGAYLSGARMMLRRLREECLTLEDHFTSGKKGKGDKLTVTSEMKVCNKAFIELILSSKLNTDRFLEGSHTIGYKDLERDKKGKLVKCRACFTRKVVKYEEV